MLEIPFYLVDAFTDRPFSGNPAAVCPLVDWLDDETLLNMAREHNQSETAFFVRTDGGFELRWFTTRGEINLCGHATLASAHVIFEYLDYPQAEIIFSTRFAGDLTVRRSGDWLTLDFPAWETHPEEAAPLLLASLGAEGVREVRAGRDYLVVLENERQLAALTPDIHAMLPLNKMVCVTAPGDEVDFVSRFFCPGESVAEDPVTGSTHSMLIPFWGARLNKTNMLARQLSARGGELRCEWRGERVLIGGQARIYAIGSVFLPGVV